MQTVAILDETMVRFDQGPTDLPGAPSRWKLRRWASKGLRTPSGERVTLEWCYDGGKPVTSMEAWMRFQKAVNGETDNGEESKHA